jgi:hypothetical protein
MKKNAMNKMDKNIKGIYDNLKNNKTNMIEIIQNTICAKMCIIEYSITYDVAFMEFI